MASRASSYLEDFKRTATSSMTDTNSSSASRPDLLSATSSLSLDENISREDIDLILKRNWHLEELMIPIREKLVFLSGGRDKRGGGILTIHPSDKSDMGPINIGKLMAYFSRIPSPAVCQQGFTIILDIRQTSWHVAKKTLKSLQHTFQNQISQVLLVKPKSFWKRPRVATGLALRKSKYTFSIEVLDVASDLAQVLPPSQITRELGGTLAYNHEKWIECQGSLEKHLLSLQGRLEDFEQIQHQLEEDEDPGDLENARDSVRRHVETKQQLEKLDLDIACEAVSHTIGKLLPCDNPDFVACFSYLEELCSQLQETRDKLEQLWRLKGSRLDKLLQIRLFESDTSKIEAWLLHEVSVLAQDHTSIGDCMGAAQMKKSAFSEYAEKFKLKYQDLSHTVGMGDKLVATHHFAREQIQHKLDELKEKWEVLKGVVEDRVELLDLSVSFHDSQQQFFQNVEAWLDECQSKQKPSDTSQTEEALTNHKQLRESCDALHSTVQQDGKKLVEKLRRPVGDSSLPTGFVMGTRHVKEILENLYDERSWIDEQWGKRQTMLTRTLNLCKFQDQAKEVYNWFSHKGKPFLTSSTSVGRSEDDTTQLLSRHESFETSARETYTLADRLRALTAELSSSKKCEPEEIKREEVALQGAVDQFSDNMRSRKAIILQVMDYFKKLNELEATLTSLACPLPNAHFQGPSEVVEPLLRDFQAQCKRAKEMADSVHQLCSDLLSMLRKATAEALGMGVVLDYVEAKEELAKREEKERGRQEEVWQVCDRKERRLDLTMQLNQFKEDLKEHVLRMESWIEKDDTEWGHAPNIIEAKLHQDAFQGNYDTLCHTHQALGERGRGVASDIAHLEEIMFPGAVVSADAHPAVRVVKEKLTEAEKVYKEMVGVASEWLRVLKDCYQFHLIKQTSSKLASSLAELSGVLLHMSGIGHSLEEAVSQHDRVSEVQRSLAEVKKRVEELQGEVDKCVERDRYGSALLREDVGVVLQKKLATVEEQVENKMLVASTLLDFYRNMKNLRVTFDECEAEFSSKDASHTIPELDQQLRETSDKKVFMEQAIGVVLSQGSKARGLIAPKTSPNTRGIVGQKSFPPASGDAQPRDELSMSLNLPDGMSRAQSSEYLSENPKLTVSNSSHASEDDLSLNLASSKGELEVSLPQIRPRSQNLKSPKSKGKGKHTRTKSWDLLDSRDIDLKNKNSGDEGLKTPTQDLPKLLVSPKRTSKSSLKSAQSLQSISETDKDRKMLEGYLDEVKGRLDRLLVLWEERKGMLEEARKALEFLEAAPEIFDWLNADGAGFIAKYDTYGRSIEEVQNLLQDCSKFEQTEVVEKSEKVSQMLSHYRPIQNLPEVKCRYSDLQSLWEKFEKDVRKTVTHMELALKFHQGMLEASRWCQTTMNFLDHMFTQSEEVKRSEEASALVSKVTDHVTDSVDLQEARIDQLKITSLSLANFQLSQMADRIARTTEDTVSEYLTCKSSLEELQKHFQHKESERDRIEKVTKKREHVLQELLATEEAYVNDLRLVVERFRPRFVDDLLPHTLKGKEEVIFGNVHKIQKFHKIFFFPKMKEVEGNWEELASLFVDSLDEMTDLYVPFCQGKGASEELLASHRTYLYRVQSMFGIETPLSTLLIKPIQRITKYPLLLKDILKYSQQLGQPTSGIQLGVDATGKLLQATNDAVHAFHLDNFKELTIGLGKLLYQSSLHVSGSKFGFKGEKERHVFCYEHALLFSRKVELLQGPEGAFKYEFKSKTALSHKVQVIEFMEAEPTKFILATSDQKLHFKAPTLEEKQRWVRVLRSSIVKKSNEAAKLTVPSVAVPVPPISNGVVSPSGSAVDFKQVNGISRLSTDWERSKTPSPQSSPRLDRKRSMSEEMLLGPPTGGEARGRSASPKSMENDQYVVTMDYPPEPSDVYLELSLKKGDIVQVLDQHSGGRWFVRANMGGEAYAHGWFPSEHLQSLMETEPSEETDAKDNWIQITAGPLSGTSDGHSKKLNKESRAFGSHDIHSMNVISNLKKVTIALEGGADSMGVGSEIGGADQVGMANGNGPVEDDDEEDDDEGTSLDFTSLDIGPSSARQYRSQTLPAVFSDETLPEAEVATLPQPPLPNPSPSPSPGSSPHSSTSRKRSKTESIITSPIHTSSDDPFRKSMFQRKNVIKVPTKKRKKRGSENVRRTSSIRSETSSVGVASTESGEVEEGVSERLPSSSGSSDTLNQTKDNATKATDAAEVQSESEAEKEKERDRRLQKIEFIVAEIKQTEQTYVKYLGDAIKIYLSEMKSPNLPEQLKGKEATIFGNLPSLHAFHKDIFLKSLEADDSSVEGIGKCFIDCTRHFEKYVTYSENKIKSETFLWTYQNRNGGTFFEELQNRHGQRQGLDSLLIMPIQRVSRYKLLLGDLQKSAKKVGLTTPLLDKAVQLMLDVPRRANDAMTLSSIYGYDGNIHKHGQLLLQDVFVVYERNKRTGSRRQLFLLEQRLIITKEKDQDSLYVFKDALKVYSLSVAEKEGDDPNRFAVGTGTVGDWDQYYLLEAPTVEKKKEWLEALKDIMKGQFDLLKALASTSPNPLNRNPLDSVTSPRRDNAVAMIQLSDDSEQEFDETAANNPLSAIGCPSPNMFCPVNFNIAKDMTSMSRQKSMPGSSVSDADPILGKRSRKLNLYMVAEDCAPPKDNEGIIYIHKGQIFDILDFSSDWWLARLVRDVVPKSPKVCEQGWVPGTFLDKFEGTLSREEEDFIWTEYQKRQDKQQYGVTKTPSGRMLLPDSYSNTLPLPKDKKKRKKQLSINAGDTHVRITSTFSYQADVEMRETKKAQEAVLTPKAPTLVTSLTDQLISVGHSIKFQCHLQGDAHPPPNVEWSKDGHKLVINRAFFSVGEKLVQLRIKGVELEDEGKYTCVLSNDSGSVKTSARLTVTGPPSMPGTPSVKILGSDSIQLSWTQPTTDGHSPITHYIVECRDMASERWSSILQRVVDLNTVVTDLVPADYVFRVLAINQHGAGHPSPESTNVNLLPMRQTKPTDYSLEPFEDKYDLQNIIGRGQFGMVLECMYKVTQQVYACKLLPLDVGRDHAHQELEMLCNLDHPNIVQITDSYLTHQHFILVFQKVCGASLMEYFAHHENLTDPLCALSVEQVFQAIQYLHLQGIGHFSIKPQNVMASEVVGDPLPHVKLIHFERARKVSSSLIVKIAPEIDYEAPEILCERPVTCAADMWSLGAFVYALYSGFSPFHSDSFDLTKENICGNHFTFSKRKPFTETAMDFIKKLLVKDISIRINSGQALRHSWFEVGRLLFNDPLAKYPKLGVAHLKTALSRETWSTAGPLQSQPFSVKLN